MRINNNLIAINTHRQMGISENSGAKSMEKLSSGFRINRAGDDAAGLAISEKMRGQIRGLGMASRNAQDTISLIQTAEGALAETHDILQRMRELSVQSANDTNTDADRKELQSEVDQLRLEIDRIANSTEFNTKKLLEGSARGVSDEVPGTARLNNNSQVNLDTLKKNAMMESVGSDKSWAFDGAFMLIKTVQTFDKDGGRVYNANDFKLVGPDGIIYDFKTLSADTKIKASELEAGTIIADGGATVNMPSKDTLTNNNIKAPIILGAALTHGDISKVAENSVLAAGSSFTIIAGQAVTFGGTGTGAKSISYDASGVLQLTTSGTPTKTIDIEVGKSITLDDGTILRNGGGGLVTVESGSITAGTGGLEFNNNISTIYIASQSVLDTASETYRDNVNIVMASNYTVSAGELGVNVTIGNGVNLTGNTDSSKNGNGDITLLKEGSILAKGSSIELLGDPAGPVTSVTILVSGNEVDISYDPLNQILKVGNNVVAPGKSITLDDGSVITHSAVLNDPNQATGKIIVETGRIILAEDICADTNAGAGSQNVAAFTLTKDSTLATGTKVKTGDGTNGTKLMAGTVITSPDKFYPGSVTLANGGTALQFSANTGNGLQARYYEADVGQSLTFIFSRYEPAANNLKDSIMAQIGANSGQTAFVSMGDMRAKALNVADIDIASKFGAATAIETVNNALQRVSHQRGMLGAMQNRLEHTIKNLDTSAENLQAAESRIRDVDMAKEVMENTKQSILQQSAQAMLAQANQIPQNVLQLLR